MFESKKINGNHIDDASNVSENARIEVLQSITKLGLIVVFVDHIFSCFYNNYLINHISSFLCYLIFFSILYFIRTKKYNLAKYTISIAGTLVVILHHYLYGHNIAIEMLYLILIIITTYMFDIKRSVVSLIILLSFYLVFQYISITHPIPLGFLYSKLQLKLLLFGFAIAIITYFFRVIIREDISYGIIKSQQNERLVEHNEQLRRFNYILANDLKSPLRNIVSFSNLLSRDKELDSDTEDEYINFIIDGGKKLDNIIETIKDFQELAATSFEEEDINLVDIIQSTVRELQTQITDQKITITAEYLDVFKGYRYPLYIIIKNILENILATYPNQNINIHFSFERIDRQLQIYLKTTVIEDNTLSISTPAKQAVFTSFQKDNRSELSTEFITIYKMLQKINGNIFYTYNNDTYLIEIPTN